MLNFNVNDSFANYNFKCYIQKLTFAWMFLTRYQNYLKLYSSFERNFEKFLNVFEIINYIFRLQHWTTSSITMLVVQLNKKITPFLIFLSKN